MVGWVGSSSRFVQNVINNPKMSHVTLIKAVRRLAEVFSTFDGTLLFRINFI